MNGKWGFTKGTQTLIAPQYDTAFSFDKSNRIALVANKNELNKVINPLTGEEERSFDYFFIDSENKKLKVQAENFPDSMYTLPDQQELQYNYLDSSEHFKVLFQNKIYLFSKKGKQLSSGYDNIIQAEKRSFFEIENISEVDKKIFRRKGLIDSNGIMLVKCSYNEVIINSDDSVIYCCSAVFRTVSNDDVYNYHGKLIYTNKNHIEFSSGAIHVMKTYKPSELFIIENKLTNENYEVTGTEFYNLKRNKALVVNKDSWFVYDLISMKRQKVDKAGYFKNFYLLLY